MIVEANMPKGQLVPLVSFLNVENKEDIDQQDRTVIDINNTLD